MKITDYDIKISIATCMNRAMDNNTYNLMSTDDLKKLEEDTEELFKIYLRLTNKWINKLMSSSKE